MRNTFKTSLLVSDASGFIGKGLIGTTATGELYVDGADADFASPAGKTFSISGKILGITGQAAMNLLQKYDLMDKVVGVEMGSVTITVGDDMTVHGSWDGDKCTLDYSAVVAAAFASIGNIVISVSVKGFFNSMAIDNVAITGQGTLAAPAA